jgi:hypothetical protein
MMTLVLPTLILKWKRRYVLMHSLVPFQSFRSATSEEQSRLPDVKQSRLQNDTHQTTAGLSTSTTGDSQAYSPSGNKTANDHQNGGKLL